MGRMYPEYHSSSSIGCGEVVVIMVVVVHVKRGVGGEGQDVDSRFRLWRIKLDTRFSNVRRKIGDRILDTRFSILVKTKSLKLKTQNHSLKFKSS